MAYALWLCRIGMATGLCLGANAALSAQASPPATPTAAAPAAVLPRPPVTNPAVVRASTDLKPVALTRLIVKMDPGVTFATLKFGMFCGVSRTLTWNGGTSEMKLTQFQDSFKSRMEAAGFTVQGGSDNLFEQSATTTDFMIAGVITNLHAQLCAPRQGDTTTVKGDVSMDVKWEVYSSLQHQVVATIKTSDDFEQRDLRAGGFAAMLSAAFDSNVDLLAASPDLRKALTGTPYKAGQLVGPSTQARIPLVGASNAAPRPIEEASGSVVVVKAGNGEGSAALISSDGYMLTAAHVVGEAADVKVRWSDGLETIGKVVRTNKGRDVALIKTDSRGRDPLPIRRAPAVVGETVFAIGAPMGDRFQGTVTRGIVSAKRIVDGYAFIQSDVTVNHGSSGGPLLDEKGRLLGLTVSTLALGGVIPTGVSLFVPARDAADFLALDPG